MNNFEKCEQEEATHVKIISHEEDLTYGAFYIYYYDADPSEETHFIILDNGIPFYDFECVMKVDYYKVKGGL